MNSIVMTPDGEKRDMKVGLFDLYSSGHHLPYAKFVSDALSESGVYDVHFVTLDATERQSEYFDPENIVFLDAPDAPSIEDRSEDFCVVADRFVAKFASEVSERAYDVVHFLYVDDILGPLRRHWTDVEEVAKIGDLVGPFFTRGTLLRGRFIHPIVLETLRSPVVPLVDSLVPEETTHQMLWRDLLLYRCLRDDVFDRLLVHSEEAAAYLDSLGQTHPISNIPFPVPDSYRSAFSKREARNRLDLSQSETILLFFGTLRADKGINLLLEAIQSYDGPPFTLLIAGPPVATDEAAIERAARASPVDVDARLDFVTEPAPYYRAADAVVMPYEYEFGAENMSMIFQEATGSLRPIVAPDFGTLGRLVEEWNLGTSFERGSAESLAATLSSVVRGDIGFSEADMRSYARRFSSSEIHDRITELYERTISGPSREPTNSR